MSVSGQGGASAVTLGVELADTGAQACVIGQQVSAARLIKADGTEVIGLLPVMTTAVRDLSIMLKPGRDAGATLLFNWSNFCGDSPGPLQIVITVLPTDGTLTAPLDEPLVPGCLNPVEPPVFQLVGLSPLEPGSIRRCGAADLAIGDVSWTGATAEMAGGFALWDRASDACAIAGEVSVALLDSARHRLVVRIRPFGSGGPTLVLLLPGLGDPKGDLGPRPGRAEVMTFWSNWCGKRPLGPGTLVATLPNAARLSVAISDLHPPRCDSPGSPSVFSFGRVEPSPSS